MKKLLFVLLIFSSFTFAQRESLFEGDIEHGGFGGVVAKFTSVNKSFGVLVGGYGGWLINHQLLIGGGGYGLTSNIVPGTTVKEIFNFLNEPRIMFGYGGGIVEYYFSPDQVIHSSVSLLIGAGGVNYQSVFGAPNHSFWDAGVDQVFVLEPGISGEINVAKYFKLGLGLSYRYVSGVNITGLQNSDLSGISGCIAFKFGVF